MNSLPSKTKETAFQILDRTTWTNNKAQNLEKETTLIATWWTNWNHWAPSPQLWGMLRSTLRRIGTYQQSNSPLVWSPTTKPTHPSNYNEKKNCPTHDCPPCARNQKLHNLQKDEYLCPPLVHYQKNNLTTWILRNKKFSRKQQLPNPSRNIH
jgi:hypothetical protein